MVKRGLILGGALVVSVGFFACNNVFAENPSISTFTVDVANAALELTLPENISIDLNPTASGAAFGSTDLTFRVSTNNATGYTVSMTVPQTSLLHEAITGENAPTIPTLSAAVTESNFETNAWGYKPIGDLYKPVELENTSDAWIYENPTNGNSHTLALAAKVDSNTTSGAYVNTLTFTAVANPNAPKDTVHFDANNSNATGVMDNQYVYQGTMNMLKKSTYELENRRFAGWSTTTNGLGGVYYDDGATITPELTSESKTIDLYAVWANDLMPAGAAYGGSGSSGSGGTAITGTTLARAYELYYISKGWGMYIPVRDGQGNITSYRRATAASDYQGMAASDLRFAMQDMNHEICQSATNVGHQVALVDLRDYKTYYATRLADGNCWMTQNLDLDLSTSKTFTHDDTDLGWATGSTRTSWTPSADTFAYNFGGENPNWTTQYNNMMSADPGSVYLYTTNRVTFDSTPPYVTYNSLAECRADGHDDCEHYHLGNYYNFCASIASSTCYNGLFEATESVCPAGWKLPTFIGDGTFSEYAGLLYKHGIISSPGEGYNYADITTGFNVIRAYPLYFVGATYIVGNGGWTESNAYFDFNSGIVRANSYGRYNRHINQVIRCLAR